MKLLNILGTMLAFFIGGVVFHTYMSDDKSYEQLIEMTFWMVTITFVYWMNGIIDLGK